MAGKIFYRERQKVADGEKKSRFRVVAVADANIKVFTDHLRMSELEHISEATGAELIMLRRGEKKEKKHEGHKHKEKRE